MKKKLFTLLTLLLCLCSGAWAYPTTIWETDMQETITGVTQTKGRSSDSWSTSLNLTWASGYTNGFQCGGSSSALTLTFGADISVAENYVLRVYWGATSTRTLTVWANGTNDAAKIGTQSSNPNSTVRVFEYEFSEDTDLSSIKMGVNGSGGYLFKVEIVNLGPKPTTGSTNISYVLTTGSDVVSGATNNRMATISTFSTKFTASTLSFSTSNSKDGYCGAITGHTEDYSASNYVALSFKVDDGYTFEPSSVGVTIFANSTSYMKAKVDISDGTTTITSNELSCSSSADSNISFADNAFTGKKLSGTVTIKVYQWGVTSKRAYIKSPLTITGTVASAAPVTTYNVTYHANGSGEDDVVNNVSKVDDNMFTWTGHNFIGWNTQADGEGYDYEAGDAVSGDLELFAQWEAATYTLTNGVNTEGYGTVSPASVTSIAYNTATSSSTNTYTVGETVVTATPAAATAEYTYAFDSWSGLPANVTEDATVTANFNRTPVNYTLSWSSNGGDALTGSYTSGTVAFGSSIIAPNTPTRTGYTFLGWAETADGDVVEVPATMPAENKTYYAKWAVYVAPTAGVLFSMTVLNPSTKYSNSSGKETEITSTDATITGGTVYGYGQSSKTISNNSGKIKYGGGVNYIKLVLNNALAVGDVISFTCDNATGLNFNSSGESAAGDGNYPTGALNGDSYTVAAKDGLAGESVIYCWRRTDNGTNVTSITITRKNSVTLNNKSGATYGFSTFCSPNNFTVTGATAYKASLAEGKLNLTEIDGIIPAGAGVILAGVPDATVNIAYTTSDATADMEGNDLSGTTARTATATLKGSNTYFYAFQNTTNTFKEYTGTNFPANKAYVVSNVAPQSREMTMEFGETTGISNLIVNDNANIDANAPMYNLAGQKVSKNYKGIVIVNGKKYVRK